MDQHPVSGVKKPAYKKSIDLAEIFCERLTSP